MDPITIGAAIGTTVVAPLAKELVQKAAKPETIAKGINWVFSAADHFLKVKRGQASPDEPAPPLPGVGEAVEEVKDTVTDILAKPTQEALKEMEGKKPAKVTKPASPGPPRVKPDIDDFTLNLLAGQVDSLMKQLEIYVGNLQHLSEQAGQYGGEELAPIHVVNQIKLQRKSIIERLNELAGLMNQVYGVQVEGVDRLAEALDAA